MLPNSDFSAMGDVTGLSAEDITDGPLKGRTALYAEIEPSARMKQLTDEGKKVYSSIELHPQFALNGNAYVVGLAMTDTPASLGTDRLKFAAQQRAQVMAFNNQQTEPPMFTEAMEAEVIELTQQRTEEGKQWLSRVMDLIGKGRKSDSEQFSQCVRPLKMWRSLTLTSSIASIHWRRRTAKPARRLKNSPVN